MSPPDGTQRRAHAQDAPEGASWTIRICFNITVYYSHLFQSRWLHPEKVVYMDPRLRKQHIVYTLIPSTLKPLESWNPPTTHLDLHGRFPPVRFGANFRP